MKATTFIPIFLSTFFKEIRSKTLIITMIFTVILIFLINSGMDFLISMVPENAPMDLSTQKISMFFFFVSTWASVLCVIFGTDTISSDLDSGVASVLFPLPIRRIEYLVARILGTSSIVIIYFIISLALAMILLSITGSGAGFHFGVIQGVVATSLSVLGLVTVSLLLSFYMNRLLAFIGTFLFSGLLTIANQSLGSEKFADMLSDMTAFKGVGLFLYWLFPHIGTWSAMSTKFLSEEVLEVNLVFEIIHFFVTYGVLLFLINWVLNKKEV